MQLTHTDITLVNHDSGVQFTNISFNETIVPQDPFTLDIFIQAGETSIGNYISPFFRQSLIFLL
jgi:hypothetical protein